MSDGDDASALVATLRAPLDLDRAAAGWETLYEQWLTRDRWLIESEAVPLLVGCAPADWPGFLGAHDLGDSARRLAATLAAAAGCATAGAIEPVRLRACTRALGIEVPPPFARLADYIASVLPTSAVDEADVRAAVDAAGEREHILGAALALVTRFPDRCRDAHGFFDGGRIADVMLEKAALWFPAAPPQMTREEIATLLEIWLS